MTLETLELAVDKSEHSAALSAEQEQDAAICALIESARVLGSVERISILQQVSIDLSESGLPDPRKVVLLDECVVLVVPTITELSDEYLTTTLPLSEDQEALVRLVIELTEILDEQFDEIQPDQLGLDHRHVLHRRMHLLLEQFTFCAASYTPWSENLWKRIHKLYIDSWNHEATDFSAKAITGTHKAPTIERLYVTAVLTAAADPFQMPHRDIHKARNLAAAFADKVKVSCVSGYMEAPSGHHQLLVDDRVDKPALPYRAGKELDHHNVIIEIEECYRTLSERLEVLQRDKRAKDPLFSNTSRDTVISIYRHVLVKWGWQPTRSSTRVSINIDHDLVINYANIVEAFHVIESSDRSQVPLAEKIVTATSLDISDTGIGLKIVADGDWVVRVGELIALRERDTDSKKEWWLAVVRWIKSAENGVVEIGAMKIPGRMHYAHLLGLHKMKPIGKTQPSAEHLTPVVVTSNEDTDGPMAAHMIVHKNMGKTDLIHWLSFNNSDRMIKTMKPFLSTRYVLVYSCELTEPRDKPFFDAPPEKRYKFSF